MATPTTRQTLIDYCLRSLGEPVLEVNVDDDQLDDRVDEAIQYYQEYHSDAVVRKFYKHAVTGTDITNEYITLDESLLFVNRVFALNQTSSVSGEFSAEYQMHLNGLTGRSPSTDIVTYSMQKDHMALLDLKINGMTTPVVHSRHKDRLALMINWSLDVTAGEYIIVEGYETIDPDTYTDVYNDRFLKSYLTALIKKQWGLNLLKFEGVQLPGGVTLNGRQIYDDAVVDIEKLEEEMALRHETPPDFAIG
jgi:hypothetical protein